MITTGAGAAATCSCCCEDRRTWLTSYRNKSLIWRILDIGTIDKGSDVMVVLLFIFLYITPMVGILFFVNCVSLVKKISKGNPDTANNTGWGAIMFGFIVFSIIWSSSMH
jgi:hypothetical protein